MIEYTAFNSPIGKIYVAAVKEGVVKLSFSNEYLKNWRNIVRNILESESGKGQNIPEMPSSKF